MCPNLPLAGLILPAIAILLLYSYMSMYRAMQVNAEQISRLLESPAIKHAFFGMKIIVEGFYKGRDAGWFYALFGGQPENGYNNFYLKSKFPLKTEKAFYIDYPRPTKNTKLKKGKIYYLNDLFIREGWLPWDALPLYDYSKIEMIFEEMTHAAEIEEAKAAHTEAK